MFLLLPPACLRRCTVQAKRCTRKQSYPICIVACYSLQGSVFVAASIQALSGLTQMFTAPQMPIGLAIWFFVWWTAVFILSMLIVAMASTFAGYIPDPCFDQLQTNPALRINYVICATGTLTVFGILPIIMGWGYVRVNYSTDGPWLGGGLAIAAVMLIAFMCAAHCYEKCVQVGLLCYNADRHASSSSSFVCRPPTQHCRTCHGGYAISNKWQGSPVDTAVHTVSNMGSQLV